MRVWQLGATEFPPIKGLAVIPNNLPIQTTSFVGRDEEMRQLGDLLGKSRIITLTGTGGTGKTRLGLQFAANHIETFPDGVWLCELAALPQREEVLRALVTSIDAPEVIGTLRDRLVMHLSGKKALVILDNCEHVLDAASEVAEDVIRSCSSITMIATSREPLGVRGEVTFRVPSLPAPETGKSVTLVELESFGSTALFIDRLKTAAPSYEFEESQSTTIAHICNRLDGIPLAIELAAARGRAMSLEQIEMRLDDRFRLLTGGSRNALSRQQTLRALIDWSVHLLTESEREFLIRLSVFGGGWKLEAAETICAAPETGIDALDVLDLLTALVDKSLVVYERTSDRYRLLESIRQYALERLEQQSDALGLRDRHAEHYLAIADGIAGSHDAPAYVAALARFREDYENFRMAVEWMSGVDEGLERAIGALARAQSGFHALARPGEFVRLMEPLLERAKLADQSETVMEARTVTLAMRVVGGDTSALTEALKMRDQLNKFDPAFRAQWRIAIAYSLFHNGHFEDQLALLQEVRDVEAEFGVSARARAWEPYYYMQQGLCAAGQRRFEEALRWNARSLELLTREGDERGYVACLANNITIYLELGDLRRSIEISLDHNQRSTGKGVYISSRSIVLNAFGHLASSLSEDSLAGLFLGGALGMRESGGVAPDPLDLMGEDGLKRKVGDIPDLGTSIQRGRSFDWEPWFHALLSVSVEQCQDQIPNRELLI